MPVPFSISGLMMVSLMHEAAMCSTAFCRPWTAVLPQMGGEVDEALEIPTAGGWYGGTAVGWKRCHPEPFDCAQGKLREGSFLERSANQSSARSFPPGFTKLIMAT
jgi:hypothetical protein